MLFSAKYDFLYSKPFKTASTSVEAALEFLIRGEIAPRRTHSKLYSDGSRIGYRGPNEKLDPNFGTSSFSINHQSLQKTREMIGDLAFDSSFKISSIRDPYDRMISAFHYFGDNSLDYFISLKQNGMVNSIKNAFSAFINEHDAAYYDASQHFYVNSVMAIDKFVRMEFINHDLKDIFRNLNVSGEDSRTILDNIRYYKRSNRWKSGLVISDYYCQETLEIVNSRFSHWFLLGNYTLCESEADLLKYHFS